VKSNFSRCYNLPYSNFWRPYEDPCHLAVLKCHTILYYLLRPKESIWNIILKKTWSSSHLVNQENYCDGSDYVRHDFIMSLVCAVFHKMLLQGFLAATAKWIILFLWLFPFDFPRKRKIDLKGIKLLTKKKKKKFLLLFVLIRTDNCDKLN
jgi:hypothetical protein